MFFLVAPLKAIASYFYGVVLVHPDVEVYLNWAYRVAILGLGILLLQWWENYKFFVEHM